MELNLAAAARRLRAEMAGNFLVWNLSGEDRFDYNKFDYQVRGAGLAMAGLVMARMTVEDRFDCILFDHQVRVPRFPCQ